MRLYHPTILLLLAIFLFACAPTPTPTQAQVRVEVDVDGQILPASLAPGSTVQEALDSLGVTLGPLDRVDPAPATIFSDQAQVTVVRVWEEFEVEEQEIPFEQKRLPTELLPEGVEQFDPLQKGVPGTLEITYRIVFEDGVEISRSQIKSVVIQEPQPQIILFGTQQKYAPFDIPGKLFYLSQGNAMMLDGNTANRVPVVNTGDLDGRVFTLSDDGQWLLFTRLGDSDEVINTLWAVKIGDPELDIDLEVANVIHFADWEPGSTSSVVYSTVEARQAAPGWQANNDLQVRNFSVNGWVSRPATIIDTNSGGVYGWWGTDFTYSPDQTRLVYAGPDQIGFVNLEGSTQEPLLALTPLQTRSDWAWVPGVRWSPDNRALFTVEHSAPQGAVSPEESPDFDLVALLLDTGTQIPLVSKVGMFAYPLPSPIQARPDGEAGYQVAYLQAIFPGQSDSSRYRLMVMDRDGSNQQALFPSLASQGIEPSRDWGQWSPAPMETNGHYTIALLYQGNIWLVDAVTGESWQVTGDGQIARILWQ